MTTDPNENVNPSPEMEEPVPDNEASGNEVSDNDASGNEFADLLAASTASEPSEPKPGDKITGTIIQIDEHDAFVDCGTRNELAISTAELKNADGELQYEVGQEITAHVQKGKDGLQLTLAVNLRHAGGEALREAFESETPVEGKVGQTNKGGFSIDLGGVRAFCPYSQIDVRRVDDPTEFVGHSYQFKILEVSDDGRNVVVSRRALLEQERREQGAHTRESIQQGNVMQGTVTRLVPFGAFVDIGGVEGLVHISQISHQRVNDPVDVLNEGQQVQVKILEIQNLGQGRSERISLSIKALAKDPWPTTATNLNPGEDIEGKVTRLVDFGVFVELVPGIEGLIHISELANRRVIHPREILNEGDTVNVRVLDVDLNRRRISLSLRQTADYDGD